jgi:ankyrin repeat protein
MTEDNADLTLNMITEHNADPNMQDASGNTPLMITLQRIVEKKNQKRRGRKRKNPFEIELKIAKLLLNRGADANIPNKKGETSLKICMENNVSDLIQLLWKGFDFNKDPNSFFSFTKNIFDAGIQDLVL